MIGFMPRFVILLHEMPPGSSRQTHFDLMLECGGVLRTWALSKIPTPSETAAADHLADHRLAYLDYEGEVSGQRGRVTRVASGDFELIEDTTTALVARLRGNELGDELGNELNGVLSLVQDHALPHRWRVSLSAG